jgi:hypothetical protein
VAQFSTGLDTELNRRVEERRHPEGAEDDCRVAVRQNSCDDRDGQGDPDDDPSLMFLHHGAKEGLD